MAISIDSQSFRETAKKIEDLQSKGALDSAKLNSLLKNKVLTLLNLKKLIMNTQV